MSLRKLFSLRQNLLQVLKNAANNCRTKELGAVNLYSDTKQSMSFPGQLYFAEFHNNNFILQNKYFENNSLETVIMKVDNNELKCTIYGSDVYEGTHTINAVDFQFK